MKANLPQNEPKMLERWEQMGIYERIRQARKGAPRYILHDGPPYTSGPIHMGTAMNKCLKDFIVKSKTMAGFDAPYVPGWDCHGLPIEIKVDKELGGKKLQMKATDVRAECRKYAQKFLDLQRTQFKRIGVFGRFDRPYATMTPQYESVVLSTFFSFYENGFVYKGLRAVYWCMHDETALAEAEVEYENHTSPTVWVKYALLDDPAKIDPALAGKKVSTIIWTTTPWTLPASMAVAFHPDEEYVALESGGEVYIVASKLAEDAAAKCNLADPKPLAHFPGRKMERLNFQHPFLDRKILGVLADYVTMDTGTGVVHTAPSHGAEDFITGMKYGLDATSNVDEKGILRNGLPEYTGKRVWEANPPIIDLLRSRGALLHTEKTGALVSALLALPQSGDFSRDRAVVHLDGNADARRSWQERHAAHADARRNQEGEVGSGVGRRAAVEHDPDAAGLVHLAAARVGRAHRRVSCAKRAASRSTIMRSIRKSWSCSRSRAPMRGSRRSRTRFFPPERSVRTAAARSSRRKPTSSTCGWNRARAIWRWSMTSRTIRGLRICISKAAISTADGFSLPCSAPWGRTPVRRTKAWSRPDGRSTKRARRCRSRAGMTWIRSTSPAGSAEKLCGCGSRRSISAKTWSARKR